MCVNDTTEEESCIAATDVVAIRMMTWLLVDDDET
jgi:hypothetical protein